MAVLQHKAQSGFTGLTAATPFTSACTVGSTLWCFTYWDSNTATATVADPTNGSWTAIGTPQAGATGAITNYRTQMFVKFNNTASTAITVTATYSTTRADSAICMFELSSGPTLVEASNYATATAANPTQALSANFTASAICCYIFCESSAASAVGGGFTIQESALMGGNPVAANTSPSVGSNTASWTALAQATILGMAVLGNPPLITGGTTAIVNRSPLRLS